MTFLNYSWLNKLWCQTFIPEKIQVSGTGAVPNISGIQVSGSGKK